jgi:hypothetical protein
MILDKSINNLPFCEQCSILNEVCPKSCPSNCLECDDSGSCSSCLSGTYLI